MNGNASFVICRNNGISVLIVIFLRHDLTVVSVLRVLLFTVQTLHKVGAHTHIHSHIHTHKHTHTHTHTRTHTHIHSHIHTHTYTLCLSLSSVGAVELHLSGLIATASDPGMQKIQIIGFFFENRLDWQFVKFGCYYLRYVLASKPFDHA